MWLLGDRVDGAFSTWLWPLLGCWWAGGRRTSSRGREPDGVSGADWILVGIGVAIDIATYGAKPTQSGYARI